MSAVSAAVGIVTLWTRSVACKKKNQVEPEGLFGISNENATRQKAGWFGYRALRVT
ncbi:hypothetical protein PF005_g3833 [Phytophthora fragariae]|uniref:Uncharacterized protein n=1 Tax=Phytophthora fragariae TaxID=53985 RepID=A0A6A3MFG1_9STRA|nr:hypothetical protein PF003_g2432 [Phytophthora fragariae]KAE8946339.1 hypothetical protein PF009_g4046 [Phytophthora fragariae]KAE9030282.1 hypothetical protein PF011_g675 [Phytophthora fragariae]KAE9130428.1 hypothetical protein PF006_g15775 [Phytophthora fragariae]KAE9132052.1 hypothetical protein PF007_g3880 [Phytophthora fragariae]